jgi:hypothetical protein
MIVLYVLAGILILLWLLSLLRFGGWAEYGQNGFLVKIKVGPFLVQVYPRKSKGTSNEKKPKESKTSVGGSVERTSAGRTCVVAHISGYLWAQGVARRGG